MTEEGAKTMWCPFSRVGEQASGAAENRPDGSYNCIASACMAWRSLPSSSSEANTILKIAAIKRHREQHGSDLLTAKNAVEETWVQPAARGFCGLAGAPQ